MKIEGEEISNEANYLDKVTYVPGHANSDAGHPDCLQGVIMEITDMGVRVLYSKSRAVQSTSCYDLVWG